MKNHLVWCMLRYQGREFQHHRVTSLNQTARDLIVRHTDRLMEAEREHWTSTSRTSTLEWVSEHCTPIEQTDGFTCSPVYTMYVYWIPWSWNRVPTHQLFSSVAGLNSSIFLLGRHLRFSIFPIWGHLDFGIALNWALRLLISFLVCFCLRVFRLDVSQKLRNHLQRMSICVDTGNINEH